MYPSIWQILIVLVIFILLFGHKRIRELGKSLGEALSEFRKGLNGSEDVSKDAKSSLSNTSSDQQDSEKPNQPQK